jgi:hypothetical protein
MTVMYSANVLFSVSVQAAPDKLREQDLVISIAVKEVMLSLVVRIQLPQLCPSAGTIASGLITSQPVRVQVPGMLAVVQVTGVVAAKV